MERTDRQQRSSRKSNASISEGPASDFPKDAEHGASPCQWLNAAMAMWIAQEDAQPRSDRDMRRRADPAQS